MNKIAYAGCTALLPLFLIGCAPMYAPWQEEPGKVEIELGEARYVSTKDVAVEYSRKDPDGSEVTLSISGDASSAIQSQSDALKTSNEAILKLLDSLPLQ